MLEQTVLSDTKQAREKLFISLYQKAFPAWAKYISERNGTLEEAKDIFQDALIICYEKKISAPDHLKNTEAYLLGTARNLWFKKYKDNNKSVPLDSAVPEMIMPADEEKPSSKKLLRFLETTGEKCMELLRAYYYDKMPLPDMAKFFGFSGTRSATVQKYKCVEKVRKTIKEKSLAYEDFLE